MPHIPRVRAVQRAVAAATGVALVAAPLTVLTATPAQAATASVRILATNDFHGRIAANGVEAGAAVLAGAVAELRTDAGGNAVFAAAGDLIGASTFESFIANDKPTLDALNAAGLEVSAVGNHEFDKGYNDLVNRVMKPYDPVANPYGAQGGLNWTYVGANVKLRASGDPALDPTFVKTMPNGVQVGFVGAVTEHLPELVAPSGIADIEVTDIVAAVNAEADALKTNDDADVVVLLVHEGAPSTDCAAMDDDPASDFGSIVTGVGANVDAIVSGHTHLAYTCSLPVPGGAGTRPVVSAGQYGYNLNQLDLTVDTDTNEVLSVDANELVALATCTAGCDTSRPTYTPNFTADPATQAIVDAAAADAQVKGAAPLGKLAGPLYRAMRPKVAEAGTEENRGGESTLGNLVAEAQRWATRSATTGSARIAFMNPGGLRADMLGNDAGGYPAVLTYKQAANVQPFANTLVNMKLTGAQIRKVLEQQWQPAGASRPFLRLGTSKGFNYTYDPSTQKITGMWLRGKALDDATAYSVTVNSFLASGGDNFTVFAEGTDRRDTGQTDLEGMVAYMAAAGSKAPLRVSFKQRAVGVTLPSAAPAAYHAGDKVTFKLSSLAYTGTGDQTDKRVRVLLGKRRLGVFDVDNTVAPGATDDEAGRATVSLRVPGGLPGGAQTLRVNGRPTGTNVRVPLRFAGDRLQSKIRANIKPHKVRARKGHAVVRVRVRAEGQPAAGRVKVKTRAGNRTVRLNQAGRAKVRLPAFGKAGKKKVRVRFLRTDTTVAAHTTLTLKVKKAKRQQRRR